MKRTRLAFSILAIPALLQGCTALGPAWQSIPQEDRATILRTTIQVGVQALAGRALPEASCVTQTPALWPRATFVPTFRPNASTGLKASGLNPPSGDGPDGPGQLRAGTNGCLEMRTLVPGDPGNAWVPYTGAPDQIVQTNYYARYGPKFWAGHGPYMQDSDFCAARQWYLELQGRDLPCGAMEVIDTWWDKATFDSLRDQYRKLHPDTAPPPTAPSVAPPVTPPTTPPPTPPPAPVCPTGQSCKPEPMPCPACAPCQDCKPCDTCKCPDPPALAPIPSEILATCDSLPDWIPITKGRQGKESQRRRIQALAVCNYLRAQRRCEAVTLSADPEQAFRLIQLLSGFARTSEEDAVIIGFARAVVEHEEKQP